MGAMSAEHGSSSGSLHLRSVDGSCHSQGMQTDEQRAFGDWVFSQISEHVTTDTEGWAFELVHRVAGRIQAGDPEAARITPVVTWHERMTAFVVPGRYAYFSRSLLQQPLGDAGVAFAFAHELAHVRLGHLDAFGPHLQWLEKLPGGATVAALVGIGDHVLFSPEKEAAADLWAIDRCLEVGYAGEECLEAFRVLEAYSLDHHDIEGVFGRSEAPSEASVEPAEPWAGITTLMEKARAWKWHVRRGYPSLRARRAAIEERIARFRAHV